MYDHHKITTLKEKKFEPNSKIFTDKAELNQNITL